MIPKLSLHTADMSGTERNQKLDLIPFFFPKNHELSKWRPLKGRIQPVYDAHNVILPQTTHSTGMAPNSPYIMPSTKTPQSHMHRDDMGER